MKPVPISKKNFWSHQLPALLVLIVLILSFLLLFFIAHAEEDASDFPAPSDYVEYDNAEVLEILSDSSEQDAVAEGHFRGEQRFTALVTTGQYTGKTLMVEHSVSPIFGNPVEPGDNVTLTISTYASGDIRATVYQNERSLIIIAMIVIFMVMTVLVGGKVGAKSLLGLVLTIVVLIWVLLPLLLKGWNTIPTTLLICVMLACACFVILGGINRKTVCAMLGTLSGLLLATLFAGISQSVLGIDGYRLEYAEALMQLRQTGESGIIISGLLVAGVEVSALGAVMDVAMSISSAMNELADVGSSVGGEGALLTVRELFKRGMRIGRDMVGTMTNTLILAIFGSGLTMIVYIYSLSLPLHQFLSSDYLSVELISGLASSVGVILSVPLSALIAALFFGKKKQK